MVDAVDLVEVEDVGGNVVFTPEKLTDFKIDLKRVGDKLEKSVTKAVDRLVSLMGSSDQKVAFNAAQALVNMHIAVQSTISKDQLARAIAQTRLENIRLPGGEDSPLIKVDFTTIQE